MEREKMAEGNNGGLETDETPKIPPLDQKEVIGKTHRNSASAQDVQRLNALGLAMPGEPEKPSARSPEQQAAAVIPPPEQFTGYGRKPGPGEEAITIGFEQYIWPIDNEEKKKTFRSYMSQLEGAASSEGGALLNKRIQEIQSVAAVLLASEDRERKAVGELMQKELYARHALHQAYVAFRECGDGEAINNNVSKALLNEHLTYLFKELPEVWTAFLCYDSNAVGFIGLKGQEVSAFQDQVARYVEGSSLRSELPLDGKSASLIALQLWEIFGRRGESDYLIDKQTGLPIDKDPELKAIISRPGSYNEKAALIKEELDKRGRAGKLAFKGDSANKGNFVLRRLLNLSSAAYAGLNDTKGFPGIIDGIDLKQRGYFVDLLDGTETYYQTLIYERLVGQGNKTEGDYSKKELMEFKGTAQQAAAEIIRELTGVEKKKKINNKTGQPDVDDDYKGTKWEGKIFKTEWATSQDAKVNGEWVKDESSADYVRAGKIDLTGIRWKLESNNAADQATIQNINKVLEGALPGIPKPEIQGFGFEGMKREALSDWTYFGVQKPDVLRGAIMDADDSLFRIPSEEAMFKLAPKMDILWSQKTELLKNVAEFLFKKNEEKLKRPNYDVLAIRAMLQTAKGLKFIEPDKEREIRKDFLQNKLQLSKWKIFSTQPVILWIIRFLQGFGGGLLKGSTQELGKILK